MSESRMVVLLIGGVSSWLIGGTWWRPAKVFVWPLLAGLLLWSLHGWLAALTMVGVNSLPYGDKTRWPLRMLIFGSLGLPVAWLDHFFGAWWALGTLIALSLVAYLSRRFNRVSWVVFEALAGLLQGVGLIMGVLR